MAAFDPYHEWLGIAPEEQPPNHYRLLALEPLETDPQVIAAGAKRQMARVKASKTGGDSELAQRVLKEIALARNHLLDPHKKAQYDRQIEPHLQPETTRPPAAPPGEPVGRTDPRVQAVPAAEGSNAGALPENARRPAPRRRSQLVPIVLGGIAGTLLALAIIYVVRSREVISRDVSTAERAPSASAESVPLVPPTQPGTPLAPAEEIAAFAPGEDAEADEDEDAPAPDQPQLAATVQRPDPLEGPASPEYGESRPAGEGAADPAPQDGQSAEDSQDAATAESPSDPKPHPPAEAAPQPKMPPVPDDASQKQAEQRVRELLKAEFDAADTPEKQQALAARLLTLGRETTEDPDTRFVLFRLAYQLSAATGDWAGALGIVDTMGQYYAADVLQIKADVLGAVAERLQVTPQTAGSVKAVLDALAKGLDDAVAADNYDAANRFLRSARVLARKVNNPAITRELGVRQREIERMERAFGRVKTSIDSVARGSGAPRANLEAGRWYCFEKDDWARGLPLLAKGSDATLADLARRDLARPDNCLQQIQLAEHWLEAAKNEPSSTAPRLIARARHWCDQAMPKLDEALANDDYATAGRVLAVAVSVAVKTGDGQRAAELMARLKEVEQAQQRFAPVKRFLDALSRDPDDPEANLAAGKWYCFEKGLWEKGLPLVAKGADKGLASLAQWDIADPKTPQDQTKLADEWWKQAERDRGSYESAIQLRAMYWYAQALPKLTGLDKVRVQKCLAERVSHSIGKAHGEQHAIIQEGNVALASNGTTVSGPIGGSGALLDGDAVNYDGVKGYAHGQWPCEWTVTFDRVYLLQHIRFLLWDGDTRFFRYSIAASPDGETYAPCVDRSQGAWRGWQHISFSPRAVKGVKVTGLYNSAGQGFQIVEFEAYCIPPKPIKGL